MKKSIFLVLLLVFCLSANTFVVAGVMLTKTNENKTMYLRATVNPNKRSFNVRWDTVANAKKYIFLGFGVKGQKKRVVAAPKSLISFKIKNKKKFCKIRIKAYSKKNKLLAETPFLYCVNEKKKKMKYGNARSIVVTSLPGLNGYLSNGFTYKLNLKVLMRNNKQHLPKEYSNGNQVYCYSYNENIIGTKKNGVLIPRNPGVAKILVQDIGGAFCIINVHVVDNDIVGYGGDELCKFDLVNDGKRITLNKNVFGMDKVVFGYYVKNFMIARPDGSLIAGIPGYTSIDGKWIRTENTTFYAKFANKTKKIKYILNEEGTEYVQQDIDYFEAAKSYVPAPKEGYDFIEWNTKPDGTGESYKEGELIKAKNEEISVNAFYAQFAKRNLRLSYEGAYCYCYDANSEKQYGWQWIDGNKYFFDLESGDKYTGVHVINNKQYEFDQYGKLERELFSGKCRFRLSTNSNVKYLCKDDMNLLNITSRKDSEQTNFDLKYIGKGKYFISYGEYFATLNYLDNKEQKYNIKFLKNNIDAGDGSLTEDEGMYYPTNKYIEWQLIENCDGTVTFKNVHNASIRFNINNMSDRDVESFDFENNGCFDVEYINRYTPETEYDFRAVTYNVRYEANDAAGYVSDRHNRLKTVLDKYQNIDLISCNEYCTTWRKYVSDFTNAGYETVTDGTIAEQGFIFWKKEKFEKIASGTLYLSETGKYERSWGENYIRALNWVKLKHKSTGKVFFFCGTHQGLNQKFHIQSIKLILEKLRQLGAISNFPCIIVGDHNFCRFTPSYMLMTSSLVDANFETLCDPTGTFFYTNGGNYSFPACCIIDYHFVTPSDLGLTPVYYHVLSERIDGAKFVSDHAGVLVDYKFTK